MENGNNDENSSLYVVAGQPPNRDPLQRCQVHFKCQLKLGRTLSEVQLGRFMTSLPNLGYLTNENNAKQK